MLDVEERRLQCGFTLPVFGMGTWMMGGDFKRNPNNDGHADAAALAAGLERGLRHIDTAEMYAEGFAEEIVGRAIAGWKRNELFITTKVWKTHLSYDGVMRAAEGSLRRLGTDYIDLYLVHAPNDEFPLPATIRALDRLKDDRRIRNIGVSNFAVKRFKHAQALSRHKIVANQVHYNLARREAETSGLLDYCQRNDVMLIAWRPLQKGCLLLSKGEILERLGRKYEKSPAQIAINWLISQPNVVTISTMRSIRHLDENSGALSWHMDPHDIDLLRHKFPDQKPISDVVPLS